MKKIITVLCSLLLLSTSLFADNFFSKRYFEIVADVPVSASDNYFSINDVLKKEVVIDFTKIAAEMPADGLDTIIKADPSLAINLNLPKFSIGLDVGVDVFGQIGIGRDFFELLGYGYNTGDTVNTELKINVDVFASAGIKSAFNVGFFTIEVNPSAFVPIFHAVQDSSYVSITNSEDGEIDVKAEDNINIYTLANLTGFNGSALASVPSQLFNIMGFDLGGALHFKYFDNLDLWGSVRVPIVPGRLNYKTRFSASAGYKQNISQVISSSASSSESDSSSLTDYTFYYDDPLNLVFTKTAEQYYINRPFKFDAYITYNFIPDFIKFTAGGGVGVRNPFAKDQSEVSVFPEYYLECQLGLANVLVLKASSEYRDQIFKHQAAIKLNVRVIEVNVGVSLESSNFISSLKLTGLGGFANVAIGF